MVYHCLPSSFLNETVEFCGTNVPISPGNCPVYNYRFHQNKHPSYQNCRDFTLGCPTKMFHSKNVYLYSECLKINRKSQCYEAQTNCSNIIDSFKTTTETKMSRQTTTRSIMVSDDSDSLDSVNVVEMTNSEDSNQRVIYIAIPLAILLIATIIIVIVLRKRIISYYKYFISKPSGIISDTEVCTLRQMENVHNTTPKTPFEETGGCSEVLTMENGQTGYHKSEERVSLLDNMFIGAKMGQYNNFLQSLAKRMTPKVFLRIKNFVKDRREMNGKELEDIKEPNELLDYLDKKYLLFNNIVYLQGLFLACKAPDLYDRCLEYAKNRGKEITHFEAKILKSDHTKAKYVINCPDISEYDLPELEKLRLMLATLIHANHDDILVSGVKNGCVIVTMMIRNCLIPTLKALYTSEKRINMTCQWMLKLSLKYKIIKVMIQDEVIYPPDILSNAAGLTAEEKLSRHVLRSSFKAEPKNPKTNVIDTNVSNALECKEKSATCKDSVLSKDMAKSNNTLSEFTDFLNEIGGRITDDTWHAMKIHLNDFLDPEYVKEIKTTEMLTGLSDKLKLQYNMCFLEWIFDICGEPKLVKECQDLSAKFQLECFEIDIIPCDECQKLEFQFMVSEIEAYKDELQDLRYWMAKTIHVHPGQILMTNLKNGPVKATFLMGENHANAILEYLKTDDGQIAASRKRIEKIVQNGNVIKIGKALNGSIFVQIRLRLQENSSGIRAGVRKLASIFLRRTGIRMEGNEIYTRTVPSDQKTNETKAKPIKEESFIEKNRGLILENIEPLTIEHTDIAELFNREDLADMKDIIGRRYQAEYFLKMCDMLPNEKREKACEYLEEIVSLPKEKSTHEELSPAKKWIQQNREDLLDEIDSGFIKSAIYQLEDVPEEVKTSWSDPNKSRTEKAKIFLDFALQKDEYVKALKKTMEEYGMQLPE
ncbi:uncharacterized protein LOC128178800 isoform X2 [Crassostrea angulata]|uniref:uncharacterized protein LOC128178800 isoform X2 n=1 Tax=Magallana angulata TaxID=2784310 RepID=UPI0022B1F7A2|nr:uncharacterized protein LOC128178800 isoform X2 [Crassostrea angulata]